MPGASLHLLPDLIRDGLVPGCYRLGIRCGGSEQAEHHGGYRKLGKTISRLWEGLGGRGTRRCHQAHSLQLLHARQELGGHSLTSLGA